MQTKDKVMLALTIGSAIALAVSIYALAVGIDALEELWQEERIAQCIFTGEVRPDGKRLYRCPDGSYRLAGPNHRNARGE